MPRHILCLVGPTGAGKTAVALHLAHFCKGGVINSDSRQVYRAFPVVTAQPSVEEQSQCPHVLYGFLRTEERLSAGSWSDLARKELLHFTLPILVGGTGLYLRALLDGMVDIPPIPEEIQQSLLAAFQRGEQLHTQLQQIDPDYAARIHPNDRQRLVRALAVHTTTGKTFSWWHSQTPPPPTDTILRIGIKRSLSELEPLLAQRIDNMIKAGALDEVETEWRTGSPLGAPGWSGIGCREILQYILGEHTLSECKALWLKNTRAYAKRQLTWFNADKRILWFDPQDLDGIHRTVERWLQK